jgi:hypothetical protein
VIYSRRKLFTLFLLALVTSSLACHTYFDACKTSWTRVDFSPYLAAAIRLHDQDPLYVYNKDNLYTGEQYVYPPLPAMTLIPFAGAGLTALCHAWTALEIVLLAASVLLFCWSARLDPLKDTGTVLLLCLVGFLNYPTHLQILVGNIDISILLCLVACLAASRMERWKTAAIMIALAASIKTWAIVFTGYLIIMRRWKEATLAIGTFLLAGLAFFSVLGLDQFETFIKLQKAYAYQPKLNSNSIIPMCKLYSGLPTLEHHHPVILFSGAGTVLPIVGVLASMLIVAGFLTIVWRVFRAPQAASGHLVMSFCIITYLLLTPLCHQYYYVFALPVIWSLIVFAIPTKQADKAPAADWLRATILASVMVAYFLLQVEAPGLIEANAYPGFGKFALFGYGNTILAGLTLWLATALAIISGYRQKTVTTEVEQLQSDQIIAERLKHYQVQGQAVQARD